jgi:hypothetical protein
MKTLSGLVLATLLTISGAASASESIEVIVVTAKKPASMLSDMTEEIVAETGQALRDSQPALVAPKVTVSVPSTQRDSDKG